MFSYYLRLCIKNDGPRGGSIWGRRIEKYTEYTEYGHFDNYTVIYVGYVLFPKLMEWNGMIMIAEMYSRVILFYESV